MRDAYLQIIRLIFNQWPLFLFSTLNRWYCPRNNCQVNILISIRGSLLKTLSSSSFWSSCFSTDCTFWDTGRDSCSWIRTPEIDSCFRLRSPSNRSRAVWRCSCASTDLASSELPPESCVFLWACIFVDFLYSSVNFALGSTETGQWLIQNITFMPYFRSSGCLFLDPCFLHDDFLLRCEWRRFTDTVIDIREGAEVEQSHVFQLQIRLNWFDMNSILFPSFQFNNCQSWSWSSSLPSFYLHKLNFMMNSMKFNLSIHLMIICSAYRRRLLCRFVGSHSPAPIEWW